MALNDISKTELEKEYSPSMWSTRFTDRIKVLEHHLQFVTTESERSVLEVPNHLNISYGSTARQKLDIFGTDLSNDAPILVYIHGGFWQELSREISRYPVIPLYKSGVKTIVIGYDLCPDVKLSNIIEQIKEAAKFVFMYAEQMESCAVYFAGHSAGAHLVAKLLSDQNFFKQTPGSQRLQGAFLISGVYDLTNLIHTTVNDALKLNYENAIENSPYFDQYHHLRDMAIRLYVIVGQHDSYTFRRQSREFYEVLLNACLDDRMHFEIKDAYDHFDIVECYAKDRNYLRNLVVHDSGTYL